MRNEQSVRALKIAGTIVAAAICVFLVSCREKNGEAAPKPDTKPSARQPEKTAQPAIPTTADETRKTRARFDEIQRERMALRNRIGDLKRRAMTNDPAIAAQFADIRAMSQSREKKVNELPAMIQKLAEKTALIKEVSDIQSQKKTLSAQATGVQAGISSNMVAELSALDQRFAETRQKLYSVSRDIMTISRGADEKDAGIKAISEEIRAKSTALQSALASLPALAELKRRDDELKKEEMELSGEIQGASGARLQGERDKETTKVAMFRRTEEIKRDAEATDPQIAPIRKELSELQVARVRKITELSQCAQPHETRNALIKERRELLSRRRALAMSVAGTNAPVGVAANADAEVAQIDVRLKVLNTLSIEATRDYMKAAEEAKKNPEILAMDAEIAEKQRLLNERLSALPTVQELRKKMAESEKEETGERPK